MPCCSFLTISAGSAKRGGGKSEAVKPSAITNGISHSGAAGIPKKIRAGKIEPPITRAFFREMFVRKGPIAGLTINAPHMIELARNVAIGAEYLRLEK